MTKRPEIGPGTHTGLLDRDGNRIFIGDELEFDREQWGGDCRFTVGWANGELQICVAVADLTTWCRVVRPWMPSDGDVPCPA